jgi:signal transduction histidine kinase
VFVSVRARKNRLVVAVQDDGVGFNTTTNVGPRGLGLIGIRERVRELDGDCQIVSEFHKGTRILVQIPLEAA